jgi:hypothetical protein
MLRYVAWCKDLGNGYCKVGATTPARDISKKFTQKHSKAWEQSNQSNHSHLPSSVQGTSQPRWEVARAHL